MLKRFEQGVRSFHLSPLRTELFIADAVYCEWKHLPVQLCPHDSGPLPLLSLSVSLSLSSLQKITHPRTSTCPSGPKATQSCTKNSSAHNMHTPFLSTHTRLMACSFYHQISAGWHLHFYKITAFFSASVDSNVGFRDRIGEEDMLLHEIVNSWCNHFRIALFVIETSVYIENSCLGRHRDGPTRKKWHWLASFWRWS